MELGPASTDYDFAQLSAYACYHALLGKPVQKQTYRLTSRGHLTKAIQAKRDTTAFEYLTQANCMFGSSQIVDLPASRRP